MKGILRHVFVLLHESVWRCAARRPPGLSITRGEEHVFDLFFESREHAVRMVRGELVCGQAARKIDGVDVEQEKV